MNQLAVFLRKQSALSARVEAAVCLTGDAVSKNNEGDHLSMDRQLFYAFLYPFSPVLLYCSHSSPLPILCAPRPGNVIYSDVQPANHNPSFAFLLFLSFLMSSSLYLLTLHFCVVVFLLFLLTPLNNSIVALPILQ